MTKVQRLVPNLNGPNLNGPDLKAASANADAFYTDLLGLKKVMDHGWISTYAHPNQPGTQVSLLSADPSGLHPVMSIAVTDVNAMHAQATAAGHEIIYPLTDEPWGVRRFFVKDPYGNIVNIVEHKK